MACAAIWRGHSEVTLRCHLDNKSRNSFSLDHKTHASWGVVYQTIFWFGLWYRDSARRLSTNVWSCFDALSNKYHQSVFQQVLLLTIDIFLWSSLLHLLLFTNQSPYRRCCCVCVFAEHLRWHRLVSLGFEHVPPSLQWPPFSSQYFTHSCLFLSPNLPILCT